MRGGADESASACVADRSQGHSRFGVDDTVQFANRNVFLFILGDM